MEKATEVYNKLKLQFVGKLETPKPKLQEKGEEENKTEPASTGNLSWWTHFLFFFPPVLCIDSNKTRLKWQDPAIYTMTLQLAKMSCLVRANGIKPPVVLADYKTLHSAQVPAESDALEANF